MSRSIDCTAQYLYSSLKKNGNGADDFVRFRGIGVFCRRCGTEIEAYYAENCVYALRCAGGCPGVFLIEGKNPRDAANKLVGSVAEIAEEAMPL